MARIERAEKLIKRYERARERMQAIILREEQSGHPITYYQTVLRRIDREIAGLKKEIAREIEALAREQYEKAIRRAAISAGLSVAAAALIMRSKKLKEPSAGYARPDVPTIEEITFDKQREAVNALQTVGRQIKDTIRKLSLEIAGEVTGNQADVRNAQKRLADALLGADGTGLGGVEYKNGSVMPFDKYAQMVIRSTVREANNTGAIEVAAFVGSGLVKLTSHWPTCHICAPRQGRAYRLVDFPDGDERNAFPTIDKAFPGWPTYANIHPNCRHNLGALSQWEYISEEERKRLLADAGKPFDVDVRAEAEINAYNLEQTLKRRRNDNAKRYARYKAVLGGDMPTYQGWLGMKRANSERYRELQADYRYVRAIIRDGRSDEQVEKFKHIDYNAYMDASSGGRNRGTFVTLSAQTDAQLSRSIRSYIKNVEEHRSKIANPSQFVDGWDNRGDAYKAGIIKKWEKDILRNEEQLSIARGIAIERGLNYE